MALHGPPYDEYVLRTHTRSLGGVAPTFRGRVARQIFPYKPFPLLQDHVDKSEHPEGQLLFCVRMTGVRNLAANSLWIPQ